MEAVMCARNHSPKGQDENHHDRQDQKNRRQDATITQPPQAAGDAAAYALLLRGVV
jgi:hypothetical protein